MRNASSYIAPVIILSGWLFAKAAEVGAAWMKKASLAIAWSIMKL
jgi:hypothetical protein